MKALIIPVVVLAVGGSAGAGAGLYLRPAGEPDCEGGACETPAQKDAEAAGDGKGKKNEDSPETSYLSLKNQFVVPIIHADRVVSFVVISLSFEITAGAEETIYAQEPKLQDALLRVMFDHAYMGGFNGPFTESDRMLAFRDALREAAQGVIVDDIHDVLITELVRQEV